MRVRACEYCGGSGHDPECRNVTHSVEACPCPRCQKMPFIASAPHFPTRTPLVGQMKPDPGSVMRWCFSHASAECVMVRAVVGFPPFPSAVADLSPSTLGIWPTHDEHCEGVVIDGFVGINVEEDKCDFGWVARPERLKEVE